MGAYETECESPASSLSDILIEKGLISGWKLAASASAASEGHRHGQSSGSDSYAEKVNESLEVAGFETFGSL